MQRSLEDWLEWIEHLHPSRMDLGLERLREVWQRMGAPCPAQRVITVAGTNGKGSCVALTERILHAHGYTCAAYTSPHLQRFNERLRFAQIVADDASWIAGFEAVEAARGATTLTFFEFTTLAALVQMSWRDLDFAVLEVGLGGRLDAVNIIDADAVILSKIALDHTAILGNSIEQIALEKAGVLRDHQRVALAMEQVPQVLWDETQRHACEVIAYGRDVRHQTERGGFGFYGLKAPMFLPESAFERLPGEHQKIHLATILGLLEGLIDLDAARVKHALLHFEHPGRLQFLQVQPQLLVDVAHNPDSVAALAKYLDVQPCHGKTLAVCGILNDKDQRSMLHIMQPRMDEWFLASLPGERGTKWQQLQEILLQLGVAAGNIQGFSEVSAACQQALRQAQPKDRICVFGSFVTVAQALNGYHYGTTQP